MSATSLERRGDRLPRDKPRRLWVAAAFRLFYVLRRVLPAALLARTLLTADRVIWRLAWEQVAWALGDEQAFEILRPGCIQFVVCSVGPGAHVVDIGGGLGIVTLALANNASEVTYVDHSERNVGIARERCAERLNVRFMLADASDALQGNTYEVAVALHFVEHLDDPTAFLSRLRQHAQRVVLEVPDYTADPLNLARLRLGVDAHTDEDHVWEFTPEEFANVLQQAGWKLEFMKTGHGVIRVVACNSDARPSLGPPGG